MKKRQLKEIAEKIKAPEFIRDWLDRFYTPDELDLLSGHGPDPSDLGCEFLDRLLRRGVMTKDSKSIFAPANFHVRYDIWALFEGFKDIPEAIRERLNRWELDDYIGRHEQDVKTLLAGDTPEQDRIIPRYLLLNEAFFAVDEAEQLFLWPCNCRSMIQGCSKPVYTCIRFDNAQGQGYEISREKAKNIIAAANKKGLMQNGELGRDENGKRTGAICNCCPDCCFPHLMAAELNVQKIWPLTRYTAVLTEALCSRCGRCVGRCPFDAFVQNKKHLPGFDADKCRGCGLCAETCPENAIEMERIPTP